MRRWLGAALVVVAACGGGGPPRDPVPLTDEARRQFHRVAGHDRPVSCVTSGPGTTVVRLQETFFEPACLTVRAGQRIRFVNDGNARHNVTIPEEGRSIDLAPGERRGVRLSVSEAPLEVFCRFHASAGMMARITVA